MSQGAVLIAPSISVQDNLLTCPSKDGDDRKPMLEIKGKRTPPVVVIGNSCTGKIIVDAGSTIPADINTLNHHEP